MVFKCCVPRCRGNYDSENKARIFRFPKDEELLKIWLQKISRKDFKPTNNSRVCEHHFEAGCWETHEEVMDEKQGKKIVVPLKQPRLKKDAIPTIFTSYPSYMNTNMSSRICPEERKMRNDARNLKEAMQQSINSHRAYEEQRCFATLDELRERLKSYVSNFWDIVYRDEYICFLNLKIHSSVSLLYSVQINSELQLTVSYKGEEIGFLNRLKFPMRIDNINDLSNVLNIIEINQNESTVEPQVDLILSLLDNLAEVVEDKKSSLEFLQEQLKLLFTKPENYRYSPETLIFSSMFFLLSNSAYKFVRQNGPLILPHPSTIHRLSGKFNIDPLHEMNDKNFLTYAKHRVKNLESKELYVSLMIDEIHLNEFLDYKGGNVVGSAHDSIECATTAHVFMLQSLFSKFKDVVYILPVKKMTAEILFPILKKIIVTLETFGYRVVVVVTDNNKINRKCMKNFNPSSTNEADYVYPHPCDPSRPLFYCVDPVHIIKSVRNNWVNQKNPEQAMYFPSFDENSSEVFTASLLSVKKLYDLESENLLKHGYSLSQKALWPKSLDKQNVKLALQVFNETVSKSLLTYGEKHNIENNKGTSIFIEIFHWWFSIMNVKTPNKGLRWKDDRLNPLTFSENDDNLIFLNKFLIWLEKWGSMKSDTGRLTKDTYTALLITTKCIINLTEYITTELQMKYLLPGKIQTDELEYRFSLYRRMGGTNYHISLRQILEIEKKLRTCNVLQLMIKSKSKGNILVNEFVNAEVNVNDTYILNEPFLSVFVTDNDIANVQNDLAILTYLAGYCIHSVVNLRLKCEICKDNLTIDRELATDPHFEVIHNFDRGGLKYPTADIVNIVAHNFIVIKKLISDLETEFLSENNQKQIALKITMNILATKDIFIDTCLNHSYIKVMSFIISASTNTLLNNYCKSKCDALSKKSNKRKLATFSKS